MYLDSARELKHQVLAGVLPPWRTGTADDHPVRYARRLVGVAPATGGGFRLAVRVATDDATLRGWVAAVAESARDEVDVRVVGAIAPLSGAEHLRRHTRPLHRGLSIAHRDVRLGTLGAFVQRRGEPSPLVLSNSHVLALSGAAAVGDPVYSPAAADGGAADDRVGELFDHVPLSAERPNLVDAALARLDDGVAVGLPVGESPLAGPWGGDPLELLAGVEKTGRTTGRTTGRVTAFEVDAVPVGFGGDRLLTFDDQLEIDGSAGAFSADGDSGSVVCTTGSRRAAGLVFAASTSGGTGGTGLSYANHLPTVLRLLRVTMLPT